MMSSIGERASKKYFDDDTVTMEQGKLLCDIIDAEVAPLIEALRKIVAVPTNSTVTLESEALEAGLSPDELDVLMRIARQGWKCGRDEAATIAKAALAKLEKP